MVEVGGDAKQLRFDDTPRFIEVMEFRSARRRRPDVKAVFTSGYAEASLIERYSECGTAALLAKPFGMRSLARRVREVLNEAV